MGRSSQNSARHNGHPIIFRLATVSATTALRRLAPGDDDVKIRGAPKQNGETI